MSAIRFQFVERLGGGGILRTTPMAKLAIIFFVKHTFLHTIHTFFFGFEEMALILIFNFNTKLNKQK